MVVDPGVAGEAGDQPEHHPKHQIAQEQGRRVRRPRLLVAAPAAFGGDALDPVTAEVFAPIGNPVPDFAPTDRPGANLFTNSALVLDARTGELRWWYQLQANDDHDHELDQGESSFLLAH
jgi:hypothetical protein